MPKIMVVISAYVASFLLPFIIVWCDHVIVAPDAKRTAVLSRGTSVGLRGLMPVGGHAAPSSGVGTRLM